MAHRIGLDVQVIFGRAGVFSALQQSIAKPECCRRHSPPPQGANLFERTVTALVRIAQGSLAHEPGAAQTPLEEQAIRYEARFGGACLSG